MRYLATHHDTSFAEIEVQTWETRATHQYHIDHFPSANVCFGIFPDSTESFGVHDELEYIDIRRCGFDLVCVLCGTWKASVRWAGGVHKKTRIDVTSALVTLFLVPERGL